MDRVNVDLAASGVAKSYNMPVIPEVVGVSGRSAARLFSRARGAPPRGIPQVFAPAVRAEGQITKTRRYGGFLLPANRSVAIISWCKDARFIRTECPAPSTCSSASGGPWPESRRSAHGRPYHSGRERSPPEYGGSAARCAATGHRSREAQMGEIVVFNAGERRAKSSSPNEADSRLGNSVTVSPSHTLHSGRFRAAPADRPRSAAAGRRRSRLYARHPTEWTRAPICPGRSVKRRLVIPMQLLLAQGEDAAQHHFTDALRMRSAHRRAPASIREPPNTSH